MPNLTMFCITLDPAHEKIIKNLSYVPVGLGEKKFSDDCLSDRTDKIFLIKILFMVNILFIIGFGKII